MVPRQLILVPNAGHNQSLSGAVWQDIENLARSGTQRARRIPMKLRWALVVMGMWIMGSICMSVVATENFYTIDRLLDTSTNVEFHGAVQKLGTRRRATCCGISRPSSIACFPGMECRATRPRRPRAVAPRDLAGSIENAGCATTPRALGCRRDGRRCRADARVSHAADRVARTQSRLRAARSCAAGHAEILDPARRLHRRSRC